MLQRLDLRGLAGGQRSGELSSRLPRPTSQAALPVAAVREILDDVRARGDAAVRDHTLRFDGVRLEGPEGLRVPPAAVRQALDQVPAGLRESLEVAAAGIELQQQLPGASGLI